MELLELFDKAIADHQMSVFDAFTNTLDFDGTIFRAYFLEEEAADQVSKLAGAKKPTKAEAAWRIPALPNNVEYLKKLGLAWTSAASLQGIYLLAEALERLELSKRATSDLDFEGFGLTLDPYQKAGVEYMLRARRVLLTDEMGLGKTAQVLGFFHKLQDDALPALLITPLSLKDWWKQEGERCLPGRTFTTLHSKSKPLEIAMSDVCIINHDLIADGWETVERKNPKLTPIAQMLLAFPFKTVAADEAHWMKNSAAQRTKAAIQLAAGKPNRIAITGTPVQNYPKEIIPQLQFLGRLPDMGGYMYVMKTYCQGRNRYQPFHGSRNELRMNQQLRACCMIRRTMEDVKLELPPMRRSIVPIEIDNRKEYQFAEDQLIEWVKKKAEEDQAYRDSIAHLSEEVQAQMIEAHKHDKAERAKRAEAMIRIGALKDVAARGKLKAALQWIDLYCESGKKLVVFAMHKIILDKLKEHYPNAAYVTSDLDSTERTAMVKRFQEDSSVQMLIGASGTNAGSSPAGTGLTMTAAEDSITLELGWNSALHDQMEKRVHRRGQTKPVTAYYLIGVDTIEKKILALIDSKRAICEAIVDGRVSSDIPPMVDLLMDELAKS
jgi:SWI/SNF-related matrix-associated actin-dependent regulator 1 of chromatin subfamily A